MHVTLTVTEGPHVGKEFAFDRHDTFLVGRGKDAHFQLSSDDPYFSRRHFVVEVNPPRVRVSDLKSRNGILVNGAPVAVADLKDGDELKAGHTVFRVTIPQPDPDLQPTLGLGTVKSAGRGLLSTASYASGLPTVPGFVLESELGRGAMGVVYQARNSGTGGEAAVKVIRPAEGIAQKEAQRFLREARIMTALEHRNIVRCTHCGEHGGFLFLVMERVSGPDLRQRVKDRGPMEVKPAVRLMLHALEGLRHAHGKGYVHRDIKPANILMDGPKSSRIAKVADFGLARAFNESGMSGLTMQGEVGGTPAFMAPEQVTHFRDVKPAADQYAAAATLYYLLTGQFVLDFESEATSQMIQIVTDDRIPIRKRRSDVPSGLESALATALAREPDARFANVTAFRDAIRAFA